ncbi:MAG: dihydropteroate synthase [Planctomycetaceae bacterium]|nr:MAG: dihydropteroate synthase [Planctomycetaceae bacterium]
MTPRRLFVTGRLAEPALRQVLRETLGAPGDRYEIAVLPISVAALMRVEWVARKLQPSPEIHEVVLPGWCGGDISWLSQHWQKTVVRGPRDLFDLPAYLGGGVPPPVELTEHRLEILAEINHAPRLSERELLQQAEQYRAAGADIIDLGCIPGEPWPQLAHAVRMLKGEGFRLSLDSFDRGEVESAVDAGVELVLSARLDNCQWAAQLPVEWVVIPQDPQDLTGLEQAAEILHQAGRVCRWDPILEPIGYGFAASLARYYEVRRRHPQVPMLMGIGNLTELTEVDSAGVNLLLIALCTELNIGSVLTTEVANWCRSAVRECDVARRLAWYAVQHRVLPKRLDDRLLMLRDSRLVTRGEPTLQRWAAQLRDANFRIFVERGEIHVMNRAGYWRGEDPASLFDQMLRDSGPVTPEHAFYLGMELMKARTALTLGKNYVQDEALRWGLLTVAERGSHAWQGEVPGKRAEAPRAGRDPTDDDDERPQA